MDTEYTVRHARQDDAGAILSLVKQSLGEGNVPRDLSYWSWKHFANPFGASPCLVAQADGRVIGLRAFMRWSWRSNGREVCAVRAVDTATHPDWRGKGIFSQLTRALVSEMQDEGVSFVFNTPNERSRAGYLKMGWTTLGRTSLWLRPAHPLAAVRSLIGAARTNGSSRVTLMGEPPPFSRARELVDRPELATFLDSLPTDRRRLATHATLEYMRWRYADVPGLAYYAAWELSDSEGAAVVFRLKERGPLLELRLCDIVVGKSPRAIAVGRRIVRDIVRATNCNYAAAMASHDSQEGKVLAGCRFIPAPRMGPTLTVRSLNTTHSSTPDPLRRSSWRLSIGALELF